jgi:uncharacterized LabA/DUF88 family protein
MVKKRVIVYVDGFNFYFGLRSVNWKRYYWLDMVSLFDRFMGEDKELVCLRYFTARPHNQGEQQRQSAFIEANRIVSNRFHVYYGNFAARVDPTTLRRTGMEEKKTDVAIAVNMIKDVVDKACDISLLVTGDTDQVPTIRMLTQISPEHIYLAAFPPNRENDELRNMSAGRGFDLIMYEGRFKKSILPESVTNSSGRVIFCPPEWKEHMSKKGGDDPSPT